MCHVRLHLNDVQAMIVVTRPRVERFSVASTGGDHTSTLDNRLRVHVLQSTFKTNEELALEVSRIIIIMKIMKNPDADDHNDTRNILIVIILIRSCMSLKSQCRDSPEFPSSSFPGAEIKTPLVGAQGYQRFLLSKPAVGI